MFLISLTPIAPLPATRALPKNYLVWKFGPNCCLVSPSNRVCFQPRSNSWCLASPNIIKSLCDSSVPSCREVWQSHILSRRIFFTTYSSIHNLEFISPSVFFYRRLNQSNCIISVLFKCLHLAIYSSVIIESIFRRISPYTLIL